MIYYIFPILGVILAFMYAYEFDKGVRRQKELFALQCTNADLQRELDDLKRELEELKQKE